MSGEEELIARLEKLSGPDREVDDALALIAGCKLIGCQVYRDTDGTYLGSARFYTNSIDSALTLVPVSWRVQDIWQSDNGNGWHAAVRIPGYEVGSDDLCATPAIALCIAALKARSSKDGERDV